MLIELTLRRIRYIKNMVRNNDTMFDAAIHGWFSSEQNVVQLECRKTSSCTIRLHGGTISSWRVKEKEQIFVSQTTKYNWTSPINGGIYVVFPQFKTPKGYDNDFTKMLPWTLISGPDVVDGGDMEAQIQLNSDVYCMSRFKHPFSITTYIRLMESELFVLTEIHNPAEDLFKFNFSIRAFLKVPLKHSLIEGLNGVNFLDLINNTYGKVVGDFITSEKMEILFRRKKCDHVHLVRGHNFTHVLRIRNINLPSMVIWNEEAGNQPREFYIASNERREMMCYEPSFVKPMTLKPHSSIRTGLYFSLVEVSKEKEMKKNDVNKKLCE